MPTPPAAAPPRFAALRIPAYRRYFTFSLMSMMADNIEHVISYWVMFQAFHSAALGGFAVISHWVPFLLFSLYTGALADRHDCRRLIDRKSTRLNSCHVAISYAVFCLKK